MLDWQGYAIIDYHFIRSFMGEKVFVQSSMSLHTDLDTPYLP